MHLILRLLQLKQPLLDFVCPFRGIGLRGAAGVVDPSTDAALALSESLDVSEVLRLEHTGRDMTDILEQLKQRVNQKNEVYGYG